MQNKPVSMKGSGKQILIEKKIEIMEKCGEKFGNFHSRQLVPRKR